MTRHRFDALSFVFGALFVAIATIPILGMTIVEISDLAWLAPAVLVLMGAALLITSVLRGSDRNAGDAETDRTAFTDAGTDRTAFTDADPGVRHGTAADEWDQHETVAFDASRTSRAPDAPEVGDGPADE